VSENCQERALLVAQRSAHTSESRGWVGLAACYHCRMFNFGKPKTAGDWIVHVAGAIVAMFLIWWMLRIYVL
jgi:hypothetical protein